MGMGMGMGKGDWVAGWLGTPAGAGGDSFIDHMRTHASAVKGIEPSRAEPNAGQGNHQVQSLATFMSRAAVASKNEERLPPCPPCPPAHPLAVGHYERFSWNGQARDPIWLQRLTWRPRGGCHSWQWAQVQFLLLFGDEVRGREYSISACLITLVISSSGDA